MYIHFLDIYTYIYVHVCMYSYSSCGCDVCVSVAIWFPATAYVKLYTPFYRRMPGFNVSVFMAPTVRPEGTGMTIYTSVPGSNSYEGFAVDPLWNRGLPMNTSSSADAMDMKQLYVLEGCQQLRA